MVLCALDNGLDVLPRERPKAVAPPKKLVFPWWWRALLASLGTALVWCGSFPRNPANFMYLNYRALPIYPNSYVPVGAALIIVSLIPASWIERAFKRLVG